MLVRPSDIDATSGWSGGELDGEVFVAAHLAAARAHRTVGELPLGDHLEQLLEHHARLEPGERLADAEVRPPTQRDVAGDLALHAEQLRVFELAVVVARRAGHEDDA